MWRSSERLLDCEVLEMKKQAILRGLLGFPLGVAMGQFITVAASAASGYGTYSAVMPEFAAELGSELGAVALQMLLCGLMGAAFGAASVIWQLERWSIAAQSAAYFAVGAAAMLPAAYIAHWMERSAVGFAVYFGIYAGIFAAVWLGQYLSLRARLRRLNRRLGENK